MTAEDGGGSTVEMGHVKDWDATAETEDIMMTEGTTTMATETGPDFQSGALATNT